MGKYESTWFELAARAKPLHLHLLASRLTLPIISIEGLQIFSNGEPWRLITPNFTSQALLRSGRL
jgi:hypothetical protein